jgi:hypothetical protein
MVGMGSLATHTFGSTLFFDNFVKRRVVTIYIPQHQMVAREATAGEAVPTYLFALSFMPM